MTDLTIFDQLTTSNIQFKQAVQILDDFTSTGRNNTVKEFKLGGGELALLSQDALNKNITISGKRFVGRTMPVHKLLKDKSVIESGFIYLTEGIANYNLSEIKKKVSEFRPDIFLKVITQVSDVEEIVQNINDRSCILIDYNTVKNKETVLTTILEAVKSALNDKGMDNNSFKLVIDCLQRWEVEKDIFQQLHSNAFEMLKPSISFVLVLPAVAEIKDTVLLDNSSTLLIFRQDLMENQTIFKLFGQLNWKVPTELVVSKFPILERFMIKLIGDKYKKNSITQHLIESTDAFTLNKLLYNLPNGRGLVVDKLQNCLVRFEARFE